MIDVLIEHWMLIVVPAVVIIGLAVIYDMWFEDDVERAMRKTTGRSMGLIGGILTVLMGVLVEGIQFVSEVPGIVMGLIGLAGIFAGINWEIAAAIMVVAYIFMGVVRDVQQARGS